MKAGRSSILTLVLLCAGSLAAHEAVRRAGLAKRVARHTGPAAEGDGERAPACYAG